MRIESYVRKITGDGYRIIGGDMGWEVRDFCKCPSISMSLYCRPGQAKPDSYSYNSMDELIELADSDCFHDLTLCPGFYKKYAKIMRGRCYGWQLSAFSVFVGGIKLYYGNPYTGEEGFLWIVGAERLALTFKTQRSLLGFIPTYTVFIEHKNGVHRETTVTEDFGYIRYEKEFLLIDPDKKDDNLFHDDNQYLAITEYAGI